MHRLDRTTTTVVALGLLLVGVACQGDDPEVRVRLCGDVSVPRTVDGLRIALLDPEGDARREAVLPLLECPSGEVRQLPQSVGFRPFEGRARAVAQGLDDGASVIRYERRVTLASDESTTVTLALRRQCLGLTCPRGQTCIGGECRVALRESSRPTRCEGEFETDTLPDVDADAEATSDVADTTDVGGADTAAFEPATLCPGYTPADAGDTSELDAD